MKKGFTLIELLAVIVILAIISLIAIPMIVNIIEDSKEAARLRSAESYIKSVNTGLIRKSIKHAIPNGIYDVMGNGNLCYGEILDNNTCQGTEIEIEMEGTLPTSGVITLENSKIVNIQGLTIEDYVYGYDESNTLTLLYKVGEAYTVTFDTSGGTKISSVIVKPGDKLIKPKNPQKHEYKFKEWVLNNTIYNFNAIVTSDITLIATYEETELYTLIEGYDFNTSIKSLVKGSNVFSYYTKDNIVEYIEFYSNGELPKEYTLSELQSLPSIDVSKDSDETIKAYYDSTKKSIYVYSEGEIVWNDDSDYMLYRFESLKEFNIPYNVTIIGEHTFDGCSSLTSITIGDSVIAIENSAFRNCTNLVLIKVDPSNTVYEDRNSNAIIEKSTNTLIIGCKNTIIPDSVTKIGDSAFRECKSLTSITIPNSVKSIGNYAFRGCNNLTNIIISDGVVSIGEQAFSGCNNLASITIPNSVKSIGDGAFISCSSLSNITMPNGIVSIENNTFSGCSSLTNIVIPNSVISIGDRAFYGCNNLASITIPNSVKSIGVGAFFNCSSLTSVSIPDSVISIGNDAFQSCSNLTNVSIGSGVTSIGSFAFDGCNLTSAVFSNPTGWWYADSANATSGTSLDLSDKFTNANYLSGPYHYYYWKRTQTQ